MSAALRARLLLALQSDSSAEPCVHANQPVWRVRCLHCRSWLYLKPNGEPISAATLEHIVPQAWFERAQVLKQLQLAFTDRNDVRNLAIACARCNHDKGKSHDTRPSDARAQAVVLNLLQMRMQRFQAPVQPDSLATDSSDEHRP